MLRPPATCWKRYTDLGGQDLGNIAAVGTLHMQGIRFESAGNFVATPTMPDATQSVTPESCPVSAGEQWSVVVGKIDKSSVVPFVIFWGPLGAGGR